MAPGPDGTHLEIDEPGGDERSSYGVPAQVSQRVDHHFTTKTPLLPIFLDGRAGQTCETKDQESKIYVAAHVLFFQYQQNTNKYKRKNGIWVMTNLCLMKLLVQCYIISNQYLFERTRCPRGILYSTLNKKHKFAFSESLRSFSPCRDGSSFRSRTFSSSFCFRLVRTSLSNARLHRI